MNMGTIGKTYFRWRVFGPIIVGVTPETRDANLRGAKTGDTKIRLQFLEIRVKDPPPTWMTNYKYDADELVSTQMQPRNICLSFHGQFVPRADTSSTRMRTTT